MSHSQANVERSEHLGFPVSRTHSGGRSGFAHPATPRSNGCRALVVTNDAYSSVMDTECLSSDGIEVTKAPNDLRAIDVAARFTFDFVLVDLRDGAPEGMSILRGMRELDADLPVVVCRSSAASPWLDSMDDEVYDFLIEPFDFRQLRRVGRRAIKQRRLVLENRKLVRELSSKAASPSAPKRENRGVQRMATPVVLIGESAAMMEVRRLIDEGAPTDLTIVLEGESGTGKDVAARMIHQSSPRGTRGSFVKINCPSVPEQLLESELFGHEEGAFTGAIKSKPGRFEIAADGTIFLDEISTIPLSVQAKLLEVLEHKEFTRLGTNQTVKVDTRIVAASNVPFDEMIARETFRPDLYYRLDQFTIRMPALRERAEDIPLLVEFFLGKYGVMYGKDHLSISDEIIAELRHFNWPGNVRQLESVIRRFALNGREELILQAIEHNGKSTRTATEPAKDGGIYHDTEKTVILDTLNRTRWNRRKAAELLGISYNTLRRRISRYKLEETTRSYA